MQLLDIIPNFLDKTRSSLYLSNSPYDIFMRSPLIFLTMEPGILMHYERALGNSIVYFLSC